MINQTHSVHKHIDQSAKLFDIHYSLCNKYNISYDYVTPVHYDVMIEIFKILSSNETSDGKPLNLEPTEVDVQNHALVYTREYGDHWTGLYRLDNIFIDPKGNKQYVVFSPYCNQHLVMPFCRLATDEELRKHNAKI